MIAMPEDAWPRVAAIYYLVVNEKEDVDATTQHVRVPEQGWVALKGSVEEAVSRYAWGQADRVVFEAKLQDLRCYRFTLTHFGQSAVYLGHFKLEQSGWKQHPIALTWTSASARYRGDLPKHVQAFNQDLAHCHM